MVMIDTTTRCNLACSFCPNSVLSEEPGFLGDMDLCIAIRTILVHEGRGFLQAGAGIVADSVPEREYVETLNKARGLVQAVQLLSDQSRN